MKRTGMLAVVGALLSIEPAFKGWMTSTSPGAATSGAVTTLAVGMVAVSLIGLPSATGPLA